MFQCVRLSGAKFISDKNRNNGFGEIQNNGLPKHEPLGDVYLQITHQV